MNLQLYFSPGACSFVPHVGLEAAGAPFEPKLVKLPADSHRGGVLAQGAVLKDIRYSWFRSLEMP